MLHIFFPFFTLLLSCGYKIYNRAPWRQIRVYVRVADDFHVSDLLDVSRIQTVKTKNVKGLLIGLLELGDAFD
jgi:hypothetical protein